MTKTMTFPNLSRLAETDPGFAAIIKDFAFDEVIADTADLDVRRRYLSHLAVLLGSQALELFKLVLPAALDNGLQPQEIKEVLYQGTAYLGLGRVYAFIDASNDIFQDRGISLPLEAPAPTETGNRLEKGEAAQIAIFGEGMRGFSERGDKDSAHINKWLVDNCFGDYYTRKGLSYAERELMTFCYLYAQGGCEAQLRSHTAANFRNGNDTGLLIAVVSANVPYMGYPRTLNALTVVKEVANQNKESEK